MQTATFQQPDAIEMGEYDYSRRWVQNIGRGKCCRCRAVQGQVLLQHNQHLGCCPVANAAVPCLADPPRSGNPTRTVLEKMLAQMEVRMERPMLCCCSTLRFHKHLQLRCCNCCRRLPFPLASGTPLGAERAFASGSIQIYTLPTTSACLQGAERAFAFGSGMAALAAVVRLLKSGDHIVAGGTTISSSDAGRRLGQMQPVGPTS